jgi:host factor-I protein
MVYKHAISTVVPSRNVRISNAADDHDGHAEHDTAPAAGTPTDAGA